MYRNVSVFLTFSFYKFSPVYIISTVVLVNASSSYILISLNKFIDLSTTVYLQKQIIALIKSSVQRVIGKNHL